MLRTNPMRSSTAASIAAGGTVLQMPSVEQAGAIAASARRAIVAQRGTSTPTVLAWRARRSHARGDGRHWQCVRWVQPEVGQPRGASPDRLKLSREGAQTGAGHNWRSPPGSGAIRSRPELNKNLSELARLQAIGRRDFDGREMPIGTPPAAAPSQRRPPHLRLPSPPNRRRHRCDASQRLEPASVASAPAPAPAPTMADAASAVRLHLLRRHGRTCSGSGFRRLETVTRQLRSGAAGAPMPPTTAVRSRLSSMR